MFGKTVPDISLNAVANLGYADGRFGRPVYPGDTLQTVRAGSGQARAVERQDRHRLGALDRRQPAGETVLDYVRWVMVNKRDAASPRARTRGPGAARGGGRGRSSPCPTASNLSGYDSTAAGSDAIRGTTTQVGEKIDHVDGMTLEEAEHQMATRLYQNTAKVHFNQHRAQTPGSAGASSMAAMSSAWRAR